MDELTHRLGDRELKLSAATQIGPYHVQAGLPNQDAYDLIPGDGFLSLAVADGAGSLDRSAEGSELAVEVAAGMAADLLLRARREGAEVDLPRILADSILEARSTIFTLDYWEQAGSTLVLALFTDDSFAVAVLGDSFAVLQQSDGELTLVQPPSVGEFANITELLTSQKATVSMAWGRISELNGLALASDAFEQPSLERGVPTAGFWNRVFSMARDGKLRAEELIGYMDSQGKIEDDATLIALATELVPNGSAKVESAIQQQNYSLEDLIELVGIPESDLRLISEEVAGSSRPRGLPRDI